MTATCSAKNDTYHYFELLKVAKTLHNCIQTRTKQDIFGYGISHYGATFGEEHVAESG